MLTTCRQFSLGRAMVLVAVVALDLGVMVAIVRGQKFLMELASLFGPLALALQVAVARLWGADGLRRAFWVGFLWGCLLAVVWFLAALFTQLPGLLVPIQRYEDGFRWFLYDFPLEGRPGLKQTILDRRLLRSLYTGVTFSTLQLMIALIGGFLGRWMSARRPDRAALRDEDGTQPGA